MTIRYPGYFALLLLVIPIVFFAVRNYYKGRAALLLLTGRSEGDDYFGRYMIKTFFSVMFFCLFTTFAVFALAGFSWGKTPVEEDRSGLDVIFVLDVSRSMLAQDMQPNRLRTASDIALGIMQGLPDARFGVTAFKGDGIPVVPITEDRSLLESFFDHVHTGLVNAPGTNLESGLEAALRSFPPGTQRHRLIVLLSDGESLAAVSGKSPSRAAEEGIPIFAVGVGSAEGSVIRLPGGKVITTGNGKPVVTRLNEESLRSAAELSGGAYYAAREAGVVSRLLEGIRSFEESRGRMGFRLVSVSRYRVFLLPAFLCLVISVLIRSVRWKRED